MEKMDNEKIGSGATSCSTTSPGVKFPKIKKIYTEKYPTNVLQFRKVQKPLHPTQKPVELLEYLIKTYTQGGETVMDFSMGSGSTGVACMNTNRNFIGIELDSEYFNIAKHRIDEAEGRK